MKKKLNWKKICNIIFWTFFFQGLEPDRRTSSSGLSISSVTESRNTLGPADAADIVVKRRGILLIKYIINSWLLTFNLLIVSKTY